MLTCEMITILAASFFGIAYCRSGVDLSVPANTTTFECLKTNHDISYAIVRVFRSLGKTDENAPATIQAAFDSNISDLSSYIFPCITSSAYAQSNGIKCSTPEAQVDSTMQMLAASSIGFQESRINLQRMYLDIEDEVPAKYFDSDPTVNQEFLMRMVSRLEELNVPVGIYTTKTYWQNIMGNVEGYGKYPLWYPRYDAVDSLDFFAPFADFMTVEIKQTGGDVGYCGISQVDSDYSEV